MPPQQASRGKNGKPSAPSSAQTTGSGQFNKRKNGPQDTNSQSNPRAAKRNKFFDSRSIAVQNQHAALQDGELNVQSFVNSMAFEINALDESMRRTRASATSRAFQRVPFTMRRRTAAHNYKRIPKRLHKRAKREMAEDNTPTVNSRTRKPKSSRARLRAETARRLGILAKRKRLLKIKKHLGPDSDAIATRAARPKIKRNELNDLPITAPRYRKRQSNKTWLPTHLWHAKRARMTLPSEPLWGFSIPLTPTQKNYRPTHRVQWQKGAIAWDMSYMSTVSLFGKENIVQNILKDIGLTQESLWNERGSRWRSGAVHWTGNLSRKVKNAVCVIGPATIIWDPPKASVDTEADSVSRQLFIRIHPSAFHQVFNELLQLIRAYKPQPYIQDLRHEIGSIDITGPDATEALLGVLKASVSSSKQVHASKFESLLGLRDPASLPLGALLAFSIIDPRLKYPPQKVQPPPATDKQSQTRLLESLFTFRNDETHGPHQLFDRDVRFKASKLPSQRSLNRRRGKSGPGTPLEPSDVDPPIPIMLLATRNANGAGVPGTWTLLLPWKCVRAVWYSLMHYPLSTGGNPAFGGLDEIRQLSFERGQPWFPGDVPGTSAGNSWETRERQARWRTWDRKPKGKRVKWETVDLGAGRKGEVGVGWSCDFKTLFSMGDSSTGEEKTPNDKDHEMADAPEVPKSEKEKPTSNKLDDKAEIETLTDNTITHIPKNIFTTFLSSNQPPATLAPNSTVTVNIKLLGRGVVTSCARIYRLPRTTPPSAAKTSSQAEVPATQPPPQSQLELPPDLRAQWLSQRPFTSNNSTRNKSAKKEDATLTPEARRQALAQSLIGTPPASFLSADNTINTSPFPTTITANATSINGHPLCPDAADLIGFVTTGAYNLRDGRAEAIGSITAAHALRALSDENKRAKKDHKSEKGAARLCVVRDSGVGVGWLARWEVV
ncbi:POPLD domain-containing protein [Xylaria bambusicola]|uniref:POPLD domain-containing protein n=1 Tax=Xylaria bambusicola TaxID=326684 RepID=UPI00200786ED|nr:POPLD domain-containing protein [Xylaria bambusicola]KAI0521621.1 POPLD domain-containing protein [Xylaria bambusicola]